MNRLEPAQTLPQAQPSKRGPWRLLWLAVGTTALGLLLGVLGMYLSAWSCPDLSSASLSDYYWDTPMLWYLNLLPGVILIWLFYFLLGRCWLAYLAAALTMLGLTAANYYKIQLRGDPLLAGDLTLISEAGDMAGKYTLELTDPIRTVLLWAAAGLLLALLLLPRRRTIRRDLRLFGLFSAIAVAATAFGGLYCNEDLYEQTQAGEDLVNPWIDAEAYLSHGAVYAFLNTVQDLVPHPPERYDPQAAQAILESYAEADIPEEQEVNVVGIMLEAFCDLTDFPALADHEAVQAVYEPWHQLEEESVSGNLLTNIFAGGTVDTEWGFLTGYSQHQDFTKATDSYVWYFDRQGYQTRGGHPGFGWFYDRENVNQYLGFQEYWFTENHYGELVDPVDAQWNSDYILTEEIVKDLQAQLEESSRPVFSFSVSYQNHGPYEEDHTSLEVYLDPETDGLPEESCNVFNNYLHGINLTIDAVTAMVDELEAMDEPVALVLFGDHKPWGGNGNSAYAGIGADFDLSTLEGFYEYYSTPYLIWANSAAKEALDRDFQGEGGDFSPCFLMNELFEQCGWTGPAFLQYAEEIRSLTPLVHSQGLYLTPDGELTDDLPQEVADRLLEYQWVEYYREHKVVPTDGT